MKVFSLLAIAVALILPSVALANEATWRPVKMVRVGQSLLLVSGETKGGVKGFALTERR